MYFQHTNSFLIIQDCQFTDFPAANFSCFLLVLNYSGALQWKCASHFENHLAREREHLITCLVVTIIYVIYQTTVRERERERDARGIRKVRDEIFNNSSLNQFKSQQC